MEPAVQNSSGISRTCIYTAAGRAVGAREPDPAARNPDYLAEKLLGDPSTLGVEHPAVRALSASYDDAMKNMEVVNTVRMMTIRTRFIDEAVERAIAGGAKQLVILGAGLDTHAYRFQELLTHVKVFEVDRAATQAMKRQRVNDALGGPPPNLTYVSIDFQTEDLLEVLRRHGYDPTERTFFVMEGVSMYVPETAVRATLRFVASHPPGSAIVFDFVYRAMIDMIANLDWAKVPEPAKPFVKRFLDLRAVFDHPSVDGRVIHVDSTFEHEFFDVARAQGVGDIPADAHENDVLGKMRSLEADRHRRSPSPCAIGSRERAYPNRLT